MKMFMTQFSLELFSGGSETTGRENYGSEQRKFLEIHDPMTESMKRNRGQLLYQNKAFSGRINKFFLHFKVQKTSRFS